MCAQSDACTHTALILASPRAYLSRNLVTGTICWALGPAEGVTRPPRTGSAKAPLPPANKQSPRGGRASGVIPIFLVGKWSPREMLS